MNSDSGPPGNSPRTAWLLVLILLVAVGLTRFLAGHLIWLLPLGLAAIQWLAHPSIAGSLVVPPGALKVGADTLLAVATAWFLSETLLARSVFTKSWPCRLGLTVILTVSLTGFVGMLSVAVGQVTVAFTCAIQVALGLAAAGAWYACRDRTRGTDSTSPSVGQGGARGAYRWLRIGAVAVAFLAVLFTIIHAALSPVLDWDATIYHAASARFWYLGRPNPPLMSGPSIGIETSSNYPPLFPAAGLVTDLVGGGFHDLYLRLASPLLLGGLLALLFGYTRRRFGSTEASWTLLLAAGSPLLLLYGVWTTYYMLLAALAVAVLVLTDAAVQRRSWIAWAGAGSVAGLAILTSPIGWLVPGIGVLAVLVQCRPKRWPLAGGALVATALVVAAPWLVRDWLLLHDPIYPLASGLFHVAGLSGPLFAASEAELRISATRPWVGTRLPLRLAELGTAVANKNLLAVGVLPGLVFAAWRTRHRDWRFAWLGVSCLAIIAVLLAPGWYWFRYLIPLVCIAVVLCGCALARIGSANRGLVDRSGPGAGVARLVIPAMLALTAIGTGAVAIGLSLAGPGQDGIWTTQSLPQITSYMQQVRYLGSTPDLLWSTFTGDYLAWQWINRSVPAGQRIATLEDRTYYIDRPKSFFYLDGSEAEPLLHLSKPAAIVRFLELQDVHWVLISEWDEAPSTADPALKLLPMSRLLGGKYFPLREVFGVDGLQWLTSVYQVGGAPTKVAPAVFPGYTSPPPEHGHYTIEPGIVDNRIYIPTVDESPDAAFSFSYRQKGGSFRVEYQVPGTHKWQLLGRKSTTPMSGWQYLRLRLPPHIDVQMQLYVAVTGSPVTISQVRAS